LSFLQKYPVDKSKLQPLSSKRKFTKISLPELEAGDSFLNHTIDISPIKTKGVFPQNMSVRAASQLLSEAESKAYLEKSPSRIIKYMPNPAMEDLRSEIRKKQHLALS
jgi:hypothetical protein